MTYLDFIKEYIYKEPSNIGYRFVYDDNDNIVIDDSGYKREEIRDDSLYRANLMGIMLDWIFEGRHLARRRLSRSKYRKLCKKVKARHNKLSRKYRWK